VFAEDFLCFNQGDANKLFIELTEHRQMCPLIQNELTQVNERFALSEKEVALKEKHIALLKEEVELKDRHIENLIKMSELQDKQCKETIKALKPTFWDSVKDTVIKMGIGGAIVFLLMI
jgi:hypothetical protein